MRVTWHYLSKIPISNRKLQAGTHIELSHVFAIKLLPGRTMFEF